MPSLQILTVSLIMFGNLVCSFPLESLQRSAAVDVQQAVSSTKYLTSKSFSDLTIPNLNENEEIKANLTAGKYPTGGAENSFDYNSEQGRSSNNFKKETGASDIAVKSLDVTPNTQKSASLSSEESLHISPKPPKNEPTSSTETPIKVQPSKKQQLIAVGTMPRYGRAFGPLGPPPNAKTERSEATTEEHIEDLPKPVARVAVAKFPEQNINNKAESLKVELKDVPKVQQYAPYPVPPPSHHYNEGHSYPPSEIYVPPYLSQQAILPPPIPYYSQIRLNDSITRVDFLLSYDVRSEGPGAPERFGSQEKTQDGLIQGEYGFHVSNGAIRGVRYTADPNVHPQLLYDTLIKFLAL